jgi:hypothetical protein
MARACSTDPVFMLSYCRARVRLRFRQTLNYLRWRWRSPRRFRLENTADFLLSQIPKLDGMRRDTALETVLAGTVAASARTFQAAVLNARAGFPVEAQMLTRALFEDLVSAYYLQLHPELLPDMAEIEHMANEVLLRAAARFPEFTLYGPPPGHPVQRMAALTDSKLFARISKGWSGRPLHMMVDEVAADWENRGRDGAHELRRFGAIENRLNNADLHHTIGRLSKWAAGPGDRFETGPTQKGVNDALWGANWAFLQILHIAQSLGADIPME